MRFSKVLMSFLILIFLPLTMVSANEITINAEKLSAAGIVKVNLNSVNETYLKKPMKKIDAYLIYIKLKGLEKSAKAYKGRKTFKDISSVSKACQPTVNYAVNYPALGWIAKNNTFAPNSTLTVRQYTRYMLDVLGYRYGTDYSSSAILTLGSKLHIINEGDIKNPDRVLNIGDAYRITVASLSATGRDKKILSNSLCDKKILNKNTVNKYKLNDPDSDIETVEMDIEEVDN